jgi:hypothetical protein
MHIMIIIHKILNVKVVLNIIKFKFSSHLIYDTKVFQILYSIYHKQNRRPCFFIFLLSQVFNLLSCVYIKKIIILKLHYFLCLLYFLGALLFVSPLACLHLVICMILFQNDMFWT